MENIIKIIQTCHAKFIMFICRHWDEDTGVVRKNFPFAWVFSSIHRHSSQTFYHSVGALMMRQLKDLSLLPACFLQ